MEPISFSMSGEPRGKGRPRTAVRGRFASIYTDENTRRYEASIAKVVGAVMGDQPPIEGPLAVSIRLRLPIPASASKKKRAAILQRLIAFFGRIDCDNGAKAILDAMNGIVYRDDVQVMRLVVEKGPHEHPGADVRIADHEPQVWA